MRLRLKSVYHSAKSLPGKAKTLLFVRNFRASLSERRNPFHAESIVRLKVALMVPVAAVLGFVAVQAGRHWIDRQGRDGEIGRAHV